MQEGYSYACLESKLGRLSRPGDSPRRISLRYFHCSVSKFGRTRRDNLLFSQSLSFPFASSDFLAGCEVKEDRLIKVDN